MIGVPLVYSLALSLHRINMLTKRWVFVGLQNYIDDPAEPGIHRRLRADRLFRRRHRRSAASSSGMAMALVLNMRFPGRNLLRSVVLVPWAMSPVAVGILWGWMFNGDYGTLNGHPVRPRPVDKPIRWLGNGTAPSTSWRWCRSGTRRR